MSETKYILTESSEDAISLIQLISVIKKRKWIFLFSFVLISVTGIFALQWMTPQFESSIYISTLIKDGKEIDRIVDYLEKMRKMSNRRELASRMNVSLEDAATLESIEVKDPQSDNRNTFSGEIKFETRSKEAIPALGKGIIYAISNNAFLKSRADEMNAEMKSLLDATDKEIAAVQNINSSSTYNLELHNAYLSLMQKRANITERMAEIKVVEVVDGPVLPNGPSGIGKGPMAVIVIVVALLLACICAVITEVFLRA